MTAHDFFYTVWLENALRKCLPAPKSFCAIYRTKSPSLQRLDSDKGKWVSYQLRLKGITLTEVAQVAGCSLPTVSNVLAGRHSSAKVYIVLCNILGYSAVSDLFAFGKRRAA